MKKTEVELHQIAQARSELVVERTHINGNSVDTRRRATEAEKHTVAAILFGGLYAIDHGADVQSVKDACEMIGMGLLPQLNTYDTIYRNLGPMYNGPDTTIHLSGKMKECPVDPAHICTGGLS